MSALDIAAYFICVLACLGVSVLFVTLRTRLGWSIATALLIIVGVFFLARGSEQMLWLVGQSCVHVGVHVLQFSLAIVIALICAMVSAHWHASRGRSVVIVSLLSFLPCAILISEASKCGCSAAACAESIIRL